MTRGKRIFDLVFAMLLAPFVVPLAVCVGVIIAVIDGGPVFYLDDRIGQDRRPFKLLKFRTMRGAPDRHVATGGHVAVRITRLGRALRRWRLDELPQLLNVFAGDMSFVGPRPPLRRYVDLHPDVYARVLQQRPGITGLATVLFRQREEQLMAASRTPAQSDAIYRHRCIPRKARLDLFYARHRSLRLDLAILARTVTGLRAAPGAPGLIRLKA